MANIKTDLKNLDKVKLIQLITDLYKKNKSVREYVDFFIKPDELSAFSSYREKVFEAFYPRRGFGPKLSAGKQAISEFKKLEASPELVADLMLFYVETGVEFTNEFGDIDEGFYSSLGSTYGSALKLMKKEGILAKFSKRAKKVVEDTDKIGWGFHDHLWHTYYTFYDD
jgi:hypothetical protein